jgi:Tol biopolymer transport system component
MKTGQQLLHYRLIEKIGEGGMGVVWKALDRSLDREVAIKVLPDALAQDAERLSRFEREAKLLASLDHPNIATVYGLHESPPPGSGQASTRFIAMEYIPGEDLAQRLARGPLSTDDALSTAQCIAEALEVAHDSGVVHRDLKPANIKLTSDGKVKVLDFGLAKAFEAGAASGSGGPASLSLSPTMTSAGTVAGMILGTASYMSPEQAKGKSVDRRADIWAFGVVLAEMLTGTKMFDAETVSEVLAKVLMTEISLDTLPSTTPAPVRRLLGRCLERDPRRRLRDIGEARVLLEDVASGALDAVEATATPVATTTRRGWLPWAVALIAVVAAFAVWKTTTSRRNDARKPRIATSILAPPDTVFDLGRGMALSPDGTRLVFPARDAEGVRQLWIRYLDRTEAHGLVGTEDGDAPFWSPDGRHVGFFAGKKVKKLEVATGVIETLDDTPHVQGGAWGRGGSIVTAGFSNDGLRLIPATGGPAVPLDTHAMSGVESPMWPAFLPDGQHFIYMVRIYSSDEQTGEIRLGSLDGSESRVLLRANSNAVYAEPGYLLWWDDGNLRAQRFDADRLALDGESVVLIPNVRLRQETGRMLVTVSQNGFLVYQEGGERKGDELVLVDREGNEIQKIGDSGSYYGPRLSPDGRQVVVDSSDEANKGDIWILDVARGSGTRVSFFSEDDTRPRWSPDGRRVVFTSVSDSEHFGLWVWDSRGGSAARKLVSDPDGSVRATDWVSNDLLLIDRDVGGQRDLYVYSVTDDELRPWATTPYDEMTATASPDGRFAAYVSEETGRSEIWVQTFPEPGRRWRVSVNGGKWPCWGANASEVFYVAPDNRLMAVPIEWREDEGQRVPDLGTPQPLFRVDSKLHSDRQYDTLDGQRFLINRIDRTGAADPLTLVQGWPPE